MSTTARIQFVSRPGHRARHIDTQLHCPEEIQKVNSDLSLSSGSTEKNVLKKRRSKIWHLKSWLAKNFIPINFQSASSRSIKPGDITYIWGAFPRSTIRRPFILELDNPYALSYYNVQQFRKHSDYIRNKLLADNCRQIVCISQACRRNLLAELGEDLDRKVSVVYPYLDCQIESKNFSKNSIYNFIFCANDFYIKAGREVIEAFEELNKDQIRARLTMVTFLPEELSPNYEWLTLVKPGMSREVLLNEYVAKSDVLLHPSLQDSFGMVVLEALGRGVPSIITDLYALPEIGGFCGVEPIVPPFKYFNSENKADPRWWSRNLADYVKANRFHTFRDQIKGAVQQVIEQGLSDREIKKLHEQVSLKFAPAAWKDNFLNAFNRAVR